MATTSTTIKTTTDSSSTLSDLVASSDVPLALQDVTPSRVIFIDPTAGYGGDGSIEHPYNSWYAFTLQAGDVALQRGGTTASGFTITAQGDSTRGIMLGSYGTGQAQIQGTVVLNGAKNVVLDNLDITGGNAYGVVMKGDTSSTTIQNCNIHGGISGILITGATTNNNVIKDNAIFDNDCAGLWFDGANASAGSETLVSGNAIFRNGQQGILLHSSHIIVDGNSVVNNGLSGLPGESAIHVFGGSSTDASGHANVISNNVVAYQHDGGSYDGNGIQIDHWGSDNSIVGNQVFGNDGSGVSLFSSANNLVMNNVIRGNMVDGSGTHVIAYAEVYIGEAQFATGETAGNVVANNTIQATNKYAVAIQVDAAAAQQSSNVVTGNLISRTGTGSLWIWGGQTGTTVASLNALPRAGSDFEQSGSLPAIPTFDAAIMDKTFTLHSTVLKTINATGFSMLVASPGAETVTGGAAGSWMAGDGGTNTLTATGGNNLIAAGSGTTIVHGFGNDILFGGSGNNMLFAGDNDSVLVGGSGVAVMVGGAGNDVLFAGNGTGAKIMVGGGGTNSLIGGDGNDRFVLSTGLDIINHFTQGQDQIDVSGLKAMGLSDLMIVGNTEGAMIADSTGVIRAMVMGIDVSALKASDFIFGTPSVT